MKLTPNQWHGCPIRYSAIAIADPWTLVILRDLMLRGKKHFQQLLNSPEGISTNILANRLKLMEEYKLIKKQKNNQDKRSTYYQLTQKGYDLYPALIELTKWAYKYDDKTYLTEDFVAENFENPDKLLEQLLNGAVIELTEQTAEVLR